MSEPLVEPSLIKFLASCDKRVRSKSLRLILTLWLPSQSEISDDEMKKLWKGLFYCVWHTDKIQAQTKIIENISSVLIEFKLPLGLHYLSVFFVTMRREWPGIDRLRLEKFYLLIRRMMHYLFTLLKQNSWDLEVSKNAISVLHKTTFLSDDKLQGNGVNYHVASIFLDELRPFLPLRNEAFEVLLIPFVSVLTISEDSVLLGKIQSNVFNRLLLMGKNFLNVEKSGGHVNCDDEAILFGFPLLQMRLSSKLYESGSSSDCKQGNRKLLLSLHKRFLNLENELNSSGISWQNSDTNNCSKNKDLVVHSSDGNKDSVSNSSPGEGMGEEKKSSSASKKRSPKKKLKITERDSASVNCNGRNIVECQRPDHENLESRSAAELAVHSSDKNSNGNVDFLNESALANLQLQFEKVAEEAGMDSDIPSACGFQEDSGGELVCKKRKKKKKIEEQEVANFDSEADEEEDESNNNGGGSKRVKFSLKNNLIWKAKNPLPPQSLRLPPSVAPRGSALKKGIPPGPIAERIPVARKKKKAKATKRRKKAK